MNDTITTCLSDIDGEQGRLVVRGQALEQLAGRMTFEEVVSLLWEGLAPSTGDVRSHLGAARLEAFEQVRTLAECGPVGDPARFLRTALAATDSNDAVRVAATVPVALAAAWRRSMGLALIAPDRGSEHARDFLRMVNGAAPDDATVEALDCYLVTVAEHGLNASTYAARVVASTGASLAGAVTAAFCALEGPLHGGAPGPVLDMLDAIGDEGDVDAWIAGALRDGKRLMGFGHRIYRVRDPRADVLHDALMRLRDRRDSTRLRFAVRVEEAALAALARHKPDRPLRTNVEYYTALLLEAVGLPRALFTPTFAVGRVAGWIAHVYEQRRSGRLIRPVSVYRA